MMDGALPLLVLSGVVVGAFAAAFGVGGGVLIVPLLTLGFGLGQHLAEGTSLLVIVPTALFGSLVHLRNGLVDMRVALVMGVAGILGGAAGGRLALTLSSGFLENAFGVLVIVMGARMIREGLREPSASPADIAP